MNNKSYKFEPINIKNNPLIIYEKRWYYRLIKDTNKKSRSLMGDYDLNMIYNHLVICYNTDRNFLNTFIVKNTTHNKHKDDNYEIKIFAFFKSYDEFLNYVYKFNDIRNRNFFEVVFGEFRQKPHFDIDIDSKNISIYNNTIDNIADETLNIVINSCITILKKLNIDLNIDTDILIYSSHGTNKKSFHLLLNNICHDCNLEAKSFYDIIINHIKSIYGNKYIEFIDKSVYSSKQQFRILGSQKLYSDRPKVFHPKFKLKNIDYIHKYNTKVSNETYIRFCESMITHTFDCKLLPSFMSNNLQNHNLQINKSIDIDFELSVKCMNMFFDKFKSSKISCPFTLKNCINNIMVLQRNSPSYCPLCLRIHENQHPFMYITYGKLFWDCRRSISDKFFIGYIELNYIEENILSNIHEPIHIQETSNIMIGDFDIGLPNNLENTNNTQNNLTNTHINTQNNNTSNNTNLENTSNNTNLENTNNNTNLENTNNTSLENQNQVPNIENREYKNINIQSRLMRTSILYKKKDNY